MIGWKVMVGEEIEWWGIVFDWKENVGGEVIILWNKL